MNTYQFFNQSFGKYLTAQTNQSHMDAWRALSSNHPLQGGGQSRLVSGWAIIRPSGSTMQAKLAVPGIEIDDRGRTRFQAFAEELAAWDGTARMFLLFDKASIPIANLFMTLDLRAVRICMPSGVETFDYTQKASPGAGLVQRNLEKLRAKNAA
jgi:hypothetical protein